MSWKLIAILIFLISAGLPWHAQAQTATSNGPCVQWTPIPVQGTGGAITDYASFSVTNNCSYNVDSFACAYSAPNESSGTCSLQDQVFSGSSTTVVNTTPWVVASQMIPFIFAYECPEGTVLSPNSVIREPAGGNPSCIPSTRILPAAILPSAFAAQFGHPATVFATVLTDQSGINQTGCMVLLPPTAPSSLSMTYRGTDPNTNVPNSGVDVPVNMSNGKATFLLNFTATGPLQISGQQLEYSCAGFVGGISSTEVGSIDINFTTGTTANIVAEAQTAPAGGVLTVPVGGEGAFAVATDNAGNASAPAVTVSTDTGNVSLPITTTICQTNPSTGACLATPSPSLTLSINQNATPTFSVFVTASGAIANSPGTNRVFVRFRVSGSEVGATSVAVHT